MEHNTWLLLFLSLALGMLVGLQRESVSSKTAGIRTFPLITLFGTVCGLLAREYNPWILVAGFLSVAALLVMGNLRRLKEEDETSGITTEIAVLLMFAIGIYLVFGEWGVAVVLTGVITVLLHFKSKLHGWVDKIGEPDLRAVMQFVLISMVILPVLPDKTFDTYASLNPRDTWMMVVLIVGISLAGYFLYKLWGDRAGILLGAILGGIISSTATTLSYAKKAAQSRSAAKLAVFVIITASAVSLIRTVILVGIIAPLSFRQMAGPLFVELFLMIVLAGIYYLKNRHEKIKMPEQDNPAQLRTALIFACLYALVRFASAYVKNKFGDQSLYVVSIASGLTDLDAITISTAKMTNQELITPLLGWRLILSAFMANLVFKAGLANVLGKGFLGKWVSIVFAILLLAAAAIFFLWPSQNP